MNDPTAISTPAPTEPSTNPAPIEPPTGPVPDPAPVAALAPAVEGQPVAQVPLSLTDLQLPEGLTLDDATAASFFDLVQKDMTAKERANALVGFHAKLAETQVQKVVDEYARQWTETETKWKGEIETAYPGEKLAAAQANIAKVLDRYGSKEAREAFVATGAGNHPALFAFLDKIGRDLVEKTPVQGNPASGAPLSRAERLFSGVKTNG